MLDVYLHLLTQAQRRRALLGDPSWSGASQEALREQIAKQEAKTRAASASEMAAQSASSSTVPNSYRGASRSGRGHPSARPAHRGNGIRGGRGSGSSNSVSRASTSRPPSGRATLSTATRGHHPLSSSFSHSSTSTFERFLCSIAYLTQTHAQPHLHRHQPMHVPGLARQYL